MFFQWAVLTHRATTTCNIVYQLKGERIQKIYGVTSVGWAVNDVAKFSEIYSKILRKS